MDRAAFAHCDLSGCIGLATVEREGPSSIGVDTLLMTLQGAGGSLTEEQSRFFESAGVPGPLLDYLPSFVDLNVIKFYSCFISHGPDDLEFANRLYDALKEHGIDCWMYERNALTGRPPWAQIDVAVRRFDKVLLVCSRNSLERSGVLGEIERALAREEGQRKVKTSLAEEAKAAGRPAPYVDIEILFPVRLDDYVFDEWEYPRKVDVVKGHHVGDFRDPAAFEHSLVELIKALDPRSWPPPDTRGLRLPTR